MDATGTLPGWDTLAALDDDALPLLDVALLIARDEYPDLDPRRYACAQHAGNLRGVSTRVAPALKMRDQPLPVRGSGLATTTSTTTRATAISTSVRTAPGQPGVAGPGADGGGARGRAAAGGISFPGTSWCGFQDGYAGHGPVQPWPAAGRRRAANGRRRTRRQSAGSAVADPEPGLEPAILVRAAQPARGVPRARRLGARDPQRRPRAGCRLGDPRLRDRGAGYCSWGTGRCART